MGAAHRGPNPESMESPVRNNSGEQGVVDIQVPMLEEGCGRGAARELITPRDHCPFREINHKNWCSKLGWLYAFYSDSEKMEDFFSPRIYQKIS